MITLTNSFPEHINLVVPLNVANEGAAIRVATGGSGTIGSLTASGNIAPITWTIYMNPSWVSLSINSDTTTCSIEFNNAGTETNSYPYQFYLSATDGSTTAYYPVLLDVKPPFSIVTTTGATSFNIPSYDSSYPDIVFQAVGLNGTLYNTGTMFFANYLPEGMELLVNGGTTALCRVARPSADNISGGISLYNGSGVSAQFTVSGFCEQTLYDSPSLCYTGTFTVESLTAQQGTFDAGITVQYNPTLNAFEVDSFVDFIGGQQLPVTYQWQVQGSASGNIISGGTSTSPGLVWAPSSTGTVGFQLNLVGPTGEFYKTVDAFPMINGTSGIPCAASGSWEPKGAIKLSIDEVSGQSASGTTVQGWSGSTCSFTVSSPSSEIGGTEQIVLTFSAAGASNVESPLTLSTTTAVLTQQNPTTTVTFTMPTSSIHEKWVIQIAAQNSPTSPNRWGYAQVVCLSNGPRPFDVTVDVTTLNTDNTDFAPQFSIIPVVSADGTIYTNIPVSTADSADINVYVTSIPSGAYITGIIFPTEEYEIGIGVVSPGTYKLSVLSSGSAVLPNGENFTDGSTEVTLVASWNYTPTEIINLQSSATAVPDNTPFSVSWTSLGMYPNMNVSLQTNSNQTTQNVNVTNPTTMQQVGPSVVSVFASNDPLPGFCYSVPILILSSSVTNAAPLPDSPTVGIIDEFFNLSLQWNPVTVDGSYQAYRDWNIWLTNLPNGSPQLQSIKDNLPTGLEVKGSTLASREYETTVSAGDWEVSMQALTSNPLIAENSAGWVTPLEFPTAITSASVTFDNQSISLGQTLNISLDPAYVGADKWRVVYPDGTNSGWTPISVKTIVTVFNTAGSLALIIQTLRDYSTATPPVQLMRQVTKDIFVMDQQYIGVTVNVGITGTLGFGGEIGFEIIDDSAGGGTLAPYEVVVRALVRDTLTNELKLMISTSRTSNASSLLGTMAIDIFPIQGRPRVADLVDPALVLTESMTLPANPVRIGTVALPNIVVGKPMADFPLQVVTNSGAAPFSWYADGLPTGVKLSTSGVLSGTALQMGNFPVDFVVIDSNVPPFISHATLNLTVETDLTITSTTLPQATVNTPYNQQIVNSGGLPPYTWELVSGAAPIGLSVNAATGVMEGTPVTYNSTTDFLNPYTFTVQVTDSIGAISSSKITMTLAPAPLQLGNLDQKEVFADDVFQLTVPVFGGKAPYTLQSFTDDGVIGTGLRIVNPDAIAVMAGIAPEELTLTVANQTFNPQQVPFLVTFSLSATGGTPPYTFSQASAYQNNLQDVSIYGAQFVGYAPTSGQYSSYICVTDLYGKTAYQTVTITVQQQDEAPYSVVPVSVNLNGSTDSTKWTISKLTALPDAQLNTPYNAGSGIYYGLALYENNSPYITQKNGVTPINFSIPSGSLPPSIVAANGNSFTSQTNALEASGIVMFNVSGGENATTTGSFSFLAEFSNILNPVLQASYSTSRQSITVNETGTGTTPVVAITTSSASALANFRSVDSHYTLVSTSDTTNAPGPNTYVVPQYNIPGNARCITGSTLPNYDANNGPYTYQTQFDLTGMLPSTAILNLEIAADDILKDVLLNGVSQGITDSTLHYTVPISATINSGFISGVNTLQFIVINNNGNTEYNNGGGTPNPTSLWVQVYGTAQTVDGTTAIVPVYSTGVVNTSVPNYLSFNAGTYMALPINVEGGTPPYTLNLLTGTNLPGVGKTTIQSLPAIYCSDTPNGVYTVVLSATDSAGNTSAAISLEVEALNVTPQANYIVDSYLPTSIYENVALPANTYYVQANFSSAWAVSGLPAGVSLSATSGSVVYLTGTPTSSGSFYATFTATSITFNTTASTSQTVKVLPQSATFANPPSNVNVGISYRAVSNNAVVFVNYVGYQPNSPNLPLVTSRLGTVGSPSTTSSSSPTTVVSNLTASGFTMAFDYTCPVAGVDVLTLGNNLATEDITVTYPALNVQVNPFPTMTVSEYATTAIIQLPLTITGGVAPYTITPTSTSDPSFTISGSQISVNVSQLPVGSTTSAQILYTVTDASGQSVSGSVVASVYVQQQTTIVVNFTNYNWNLNVSTGAPFTSTIIPNQNQSIPMLGHPPYQYYVDSVTLPTALNGFVVVSPSQRVLAVQCNANSASTTIADVNASLTPNGTFVVPAVAPANAPAAGKYKIPITLRVVDSHGISSSHNVNINLTIS